MRASMAVVDLRAVVQLPPGWKHVNPPTQKDSSKPFYPPYLTCLSVANKSNFACIYHNKSNQSACGFLTQVCLQFIVAALALMALRASPKSIVCQVITRFFLIAQWRRRARGDE